MNMHIRKFAVALGAATIVGLMSGATVLAQETTQERLQDLARRVVGPELPQIDRTIRRASYDSGASYWISPVMRNAPGTISGEYYTIDRKRVARTFEFSVINPNGDNNVTAYVNCYDEAGAPLSRYNQSFTVPPMGAVNWSSSSVSLPISNDGATEEVDDVWCVVGGDRPTVVFGRTVYRLGSEVSKYHLSLERATPAAR
ncbi:hypothetical protein MNBD_ALPHA05-647 [hydrothermal vent metagenome]|uniref:Uncharacterized protein n=1 Tax=hydrothermal vent metagenome TaxID=652676 RepID=A0A3B0SN10_9ZZZZ